MNRLRLATLMYHDIVEAGEISGFQVPTARRYRLGVPQFLAHLEAIETGPLKPRTVFDLPEPLYCPARDGRQDGLLLTFDDGGRSAMRVADLLDERSWKGHFFITTSMIDTPGFVTGGDIRDLHRRGHVIGSHSHTHPNICYNLLEVEMSAEWDTSCALLAEIIGKAVVTASVPGGDMNRQIVATAAKAGIEYLFTSEPTYRPWLIGEVACFGRVPIVSSTDLGSLRQFVCFRGYCKQMAVRRLKQLVKKLFGPIYRGRIPRSHGKNGMLEAPDAKSP